MKKLLTLCALVAAMFLSSKAKANDHFGLVGAQLDVGAPDGAAVGLVIRPLSWMRTNASITYNTVAPGARLGLTIDPIDYWISPSFTIEGGKTMSGTSPFIANSPTIQYEYVNLHFGLEFGNRNSARFFLHAGPSFISGNVSNIAQLIGKDSSYTFSDPNATATIFPTAKLGFMLLF